MKSLDCCNPSVVVCMVLTAVYVRLLFVSWTSQIHLRLSFIFFPSSSFFFRVSTLSPVPVPIVNGKKFPKTFRVGFRKQEGRCRFSCHPNYHGIVSRWASYCRLFNRNDGQFRHFFSINFPGRSSEIMALFYGVGSLVNLLFPFFFGSTARLFVVLHRAPMIVCFQLCAFVFRDLLTTCFNVPPEIRFPFLLWDLSVLSRKGSIFNSLCLFDENFPKLSFSLDILDLGNLDLNLLLLLLTHSNRLLLSRSSINR